MKGVCEVRGVGGGAILLVVFQVGRIEVGKGEMNAAT